MTRAGYDPYAMVTFMQHLGVLYAPKAEHRRQVFRRPPRRARSGQALAGLPAARPQKPDPRARRWPKRSTIKAKPATAWPRSSTTKCSSPAGEHQRAAAPRRNANRARRRRTEASKRSRKPIANGNPETQAAAKFAIDQLHQSQAHALLTKPNILPLVAAMGQAKAHESEAVASITARRDPAKDQCAPSKRACRTSVRHPGSFPGPSPQRQPHRSDRQKSLGDRQRDRRGLHQVERGGQRRRHAGEEQRERHAQGQRRHLQRAGGSAQARSDPGAVALRLSKLSPDARRHGAHRQRHDPRARCGPLGAGPAGSGRRRPRPVRQALVAFAARHVKATSRSSTRRASAAAGKAIDSLGKAAIAGSQAQQLMDMARARQLQTRITMLGLGYPEDRYATMQYALQHYVKNSGIDFSTMVRDNLTPGEVAVGLDHRRRYEHHAGRGDSRSRAANRSIVDMANLRGCTPARWRFPWPCLSLVYRRPRKKKREKHRGRCDAPA